ncbi:MAG: response regulator [Candidatus Binatia bacterium]|nr:response regulator [Candidatus Binatia bacterium]MDG1960315.1 response regulator [Candidatus Binatia bacterium]MDG2008409.1 response regulator [Candidatus Binatia bacterium]
MSEFLLVVDDDHLMRTRLVRALVDRGFAAEGAENATEALAIAESRTPSRAVVDLRLQESSGIDLIRILAERFPEMRILLLTGYGSMATAVDAIRSGAENVLPKPADADDVLAAFDGALSEAEAEPAPSLARAEWEHIQRVLSDCDGNISQAARRLGLHRRSLQRKLAKRPPTN